MSASALPRLRTWSRAEYEQMIDAGILGSEDHVELIEGEIVEMSPEKSRHAVATELVAEALRAAFPKGHAIRVQHPLSLPDDSEPEPDVAVVRGSQRDYREGHPRTAVLVVEVSDSSLAYDRGRKSKIYAKAGIPEYWVVDLAKRRVHVHRKPTSGKYGRAVVVTPSGSITPLAAPGQPVRVADLLPD